MLQSTTTPSAPNLRAASVEEIRAAHELVKAKGAELLKNVFARLDDDPDFSEEDIADLPRFWCEVSDGVGDEEYELTQGSYCSARSELHHGSGESQGPCGPRAVVGPHLSPDPGGYQGCAGVVDAMGCL